MFCRDEAVDISGCGHGIEPLFPMQYVYTHLKQTIKFSTLCPVLNSMVVGVWTAKWEIFWKTKGQDKLRK